MWLSGECKSVSSGHHFLLERAIAQPSRVRSQTVRFGTQGKRTACTNLVVQLGVALLRLF
ncbi:MAG: hypothetical protein DSM106950_35825 [Stigonema ocellatum SAG 48.90 = DSM 106950]|nr:hypothetical protein [Stigonema ocellatum SAG 48.90 = DSM 106950]